MRQTQDERSLLALGLRVAGVHVALLVLLFLAFVIPQSCDRKPPEDVVRVKLIADRPSAPPSQPAPDPVEQPPEDPVEPLPVAEPPPVAPLPEAPPPPPPPTEAPPAPPEPTPEPEPEPQVEPPPEPTRTRSRTPEEIRASGLSPIQHPVEPVHPPEPPQEQWTPTFTPIEQPDFSAEAAAMEENLMQLYMQGVHRQLYAMWQQPTANEVANRRLTVELQFVVSREGYVQSSRLLRPSGIAPMDASAQRVQQVARKFATVPAALEAPLQFRVVLQLD